MKRKLENSKINNARVFEEIEEENILKRKIKLLIAMKMMKFQEDGGTFGGFEDCDLMLLQIDQQRGGTGLVIDRGYVKGLEKM